MEIVTSLVDVVSALTLIIPATVFIANAFSTARTAQKIADKHEVEIKSLNEKIVNLEKDIILMKMSPKSKDQGDTNE